MGTRNYLVELLKVAALFLVALLLFLAYFSVVVFILCDGRFIAWALALAILGPLLWLPWLRDEYYNQGQINYFKKHSWRRVSFAQKPSHHCHDTDGSNEGGVSLK